MIFKWWSADEAGECTGVRGTSDEPGIVTANHGETVIKEDGCDCHDGDGNM